MVINVKDFFIASDAIYNATDKDYHNINMLVNVAKSFARSTHQCVCVIDNFRQKFLYVSENFVNLCGQNPNTLKALGYSFFLNYVPEKELPMLLEIKRKGIELFVEIPHSERFDYTISYDFHIKCGRKCKLIHSSQTPMLMTRDGRLWLTLCVLSMSIRRAPGHIVMRKPDLNSYFEYSLNKHKWIKKDGITLSETERDVLALSAQGYTMNDIADKMCKSVDTIKAWKKSLFCKLRVNNIAEALSYAVSHKLV